MLKKTQSLANFGRLQKPKATATNKATQSTNHHGPTGALRGTIMQQAKFTWSLGFDGLNTGYIRGKWTAYVLGDGTWTLYKCGDLKHHATGKSPSVFSAKSMVSKAAN